MDNILELIVCLELWEKWKLFDSCFYIPTLLKFLITFLLNINIGVLLHILNLIMLKIGEYAT